ncbi:MAG TPA: malto-oligosyltrehalose trehalohydrolase [Aliidongia sp.]|nr:malto-oligosyltrehalose trehalohydrolase [Aliidongia sp.]
MTHYPLSFGAELVEKGVRFRFWAPDAADVSVVIDGDPPQAMQAEGGGWFSLVTDKARPGSRYRYRIGDALYPDPTSRSQPEAALGPSGVIDPGAYRWEDAGWRGIPWEKAVIYELHPGAFSESGDFAGIAERLDYLASLGITLIEIMPVAETPGRWNWGYDGVLPFAPARRYGGPDQLKRLVDACHRHGIGVILDVVYNHFGPEGNFLHAYASAFFNEARKTPWGAAINFDGAEGRAVRDFFIENALYWLKEFHLDGLRLDAVHAIEDRSAVPILVELGQRVREAFPDRPIHLTLENDKNEPSLLGYGKGGPGLYDAQWNDDFHHALHVLLTGAKGGYYEDYSDDPVGWLGRVLAEGFAYQGESSGHRGGQPRGGKSASLPPTAFINFLQNHDQVGNHAYGWRLPKFATPEALRAGAALLLLTPGLPLLFMGEEWASDAPFPFFCDFEGELADAVRNGRLEEFGSFPEFRDPEARAAIPDPLAEATFLSAKLDWAAAKKPGHREMLALYRELIALRQRHIAPLLAHAKGPDGRFVKLGKTALEVRWRLSGRELRLVANLGPEPVPVRMEPSGQVIFQSHPAVDPLPPWFVGVDLAGAR